MRAKSNPFLIIGAVQVLSFGFFLPRLGFYHDDWYMLELAARGGGLLGAIKTYAASGAFWARPVEIIQFPLFWALGGLNPAVYQGLILALGALEGCLLYIFLLPLLESSGLALAAACLSLMYPNRGVMHVWFANTPQTVTQVLVLASLVAHQRWLKSRGAGWLAAGQALYLAGALSYESGMFLPLMLAAGLAVRRLLDGVAPVRALRRTGVEMLPYVAAFAAALAWQWGGVRLLHASNPKSTHLGLSLGHVLRAYGAGFECLTNRVLHICALSAVSGTRNLGFLGVAAAAAIGAAAGLLLARVGEPKASAGTLKVAAAVGAAGFLAAYAPYALSGSYMPQIFGVMSRTNGAGAWAGGILLAALLAALRPRIAGAAHSALWALAAAAFTWTNWYGCEQWARAWSLEQSILAGIERRAPAVEGPAMILLEAPSFYDKAIVFDAHYDFDAALRLRTNRQDLRGDIVTRGMRFDPDAVRVPADGIAYPYHGLYRYRYEQDRLDRLDGPPN